MPSIKARTGVMDQLAAAVAATASASSGGIGLCGIAAFIARAPDRNGLRLMRAMSARILAIPNVI
ncbi:MAG: hypothetical protein ACRCS5_00030 [Sphingomonas sp.]|jgi:hypothetical protein|uniref:hypothetical protein n=1 Tax=Sphingomonas sp. TaxID=28214 RepID=UPI001414E614|nr:hypothetical protein [Lactobacillus crispatus]